ncbi:hypothetical protein LCGC14_2908410 [marine sediment metagenome]|uniref:Uncharacterized protein n=1 Tax=marine sediment metagenome TaxID=412755 RepID=A0A0F8XSD4_9ZZZZ
MSMEQIQQKTSKQRRTGDMEGGEVCKSLTEDDFLLCIDHIGKRLFLILNDSNANSYDENCDLNYTLMRISL